MSLDRAYDDHLETKQKKKMDTEPFRNCTKVAQFLRHTILESPTSESFKTVYPGWFYTDCPEMKTLFKDLKRNNVDIVQHDRGIYTHTCLYQVESIFPWKNRYILKIL